VLNALPTLRVGRQRGIPVVYEVRALWEDAAVDHGRTREGSLRYSASRALESFALRRADHVTTICEGLRDEIAARGIARDRITVIPNAVDTDEFRSGAEPDAALRRRLGLDGATVVGFAVPSRGIAALALDITASATRARANAAAGPRRAIFMRILTSSWLGLFKARRVGPPAR
jgi:glycosyltransferase involved in cell wall biosynthesis